MINWSELQLPPINLLSLPKGVTMKKSVLTFQLAKVRADKKRVLAVYEEHEKALKLHYAKLNEEISIADYIIAEKFTLKVRSIKYNLEEDEPTAIYCGIPVDRRLVVLSGRTNETVLKEDVLKHIKQNEY